MSRRSPVVNSPGRILSVAVALAVFCFAPFASGTDEAPGSRLKHLAEEAGRLHAAGKFQAAIPVARELLEQTQKVAGPDHPLVSQSLNNLALLLQQTRQYPEARRLFERALGIDEKELGNDHPGIVRSLTNLALVLQDQQQFDAAVRCSSEP